jgi:hypothetical protein
VKPIRWPTLLTPLAIAACQGGATVSSHGFDAAHGDATALHLDALPRDANNADASGDGGPEDGGTDSGAQDAGADAMTADGGSGDAVVGQDAVPTDATATDANLSDTGVVTESGAVILTEYLATPSAGALEWIEVHNTSAGSVMLEGITVLVDSHSVLGPQPIHAATDPTGAMGTSVPLAAGGYAYGVPNPSSAAMIPQGAVFVFGAPGVYQGDALSGNGDMITLQDVRGVTDRVDFRRSVTDQARALGPDDFPLLAGVSSSLDPAQLDPSANNSGGAWCADTFRGPTTGRANRDCRGFVISEVTCRYASLTTSSDAQRQFIEIAGPSGGLLANLIVTRVNGIAPNLGHVDQELAISGTRMPMNGLYVLADDGGMGSTLVSNANQVAMLALGHGPDAIQLVRADPARPVVLLDAFGYGTLPPGLVDSTRALPTFEATPLPNITPVVHAVNWARSDDEVDTNNNVADFRYAPIATPGARNGMRAFAVNALIPDNAIATLTATVVIRGVEFTDAMTVGFGAASARTCVFIAQDAMRCVLPYPAWGSHTAERVDVTVMTRPEDGAQVTLPAAFTWTNAANGTGSASECDYCNLQFPATLTVAAGATSANVYGRIYWAGHTDQSSGQTPGVLAQLGYGPTGTDPSASNAWTWESTVFNIKTGTGNHDDEYMATFNIATAGTYSYTYRFSIDGGLTWTYADLDAVGKILGSSSYNWMNIGVLTVN